MKHVHTAGIVACGAAIVAGLVACGGGSSHVEHFHVTALVSDGNIRCPHRRQSEKSMGYRLQSKRFCLGSG